MTQRDFLNSALVSERPARDGDGLFATTHWSTILAAKDLAVPGAHDALERLCRTYWYPLYVFVRRKGHGPPEAEDLTQDFFVRFLEKRV